MYKGRPISMKDLLEALRKIEEAMSDLPIIANAVTGSGRRSTSYPSVYERAGSGLILGFQVFRTDDEGAARLRC